MNKMLALFLYLWQLTQYLQWYGSKRTDREIYLALSPQIEKQKMYSISNFNFTFSLRTKILLCQYWAKF